MDFLSPICGKFTRALLAHQIFLEKEDSADFLFTIFHQNRPDLVNGLHNQKLPQFAIGLDFPIINEKLASKYFFVFSKEFCFLT
jgi:hypothetical protein